MYEKILVPLDGSEMAERALSYVGGVARRLNSEAILLTACAPGDYLGHPLRGYLERRCEELQSLGIKASPLVVRGDAATEILDFAEKNDIGLIIISTHGHTGPGIWPMGNIANRVLQKSRIPILLIRSSQLETVLAERELEKILVPLDGSHLAEQIIPCVEGLAEGMGSEIILLRVIEDVIKSIKLPKVAEFDWEKYGKQVVVRGEQKAKRYLNKKESALREKGVKVSSDTQTGEPAQTILQYAEDNSVGLIALATHGFSGITKWAYGSVASKLIEGCSKPILLVRPPLLTLKQE